VASIFLFSCLRRSRHVHGPESRTLPPDDLIDFHADRAFPWLMMAVGPPSHLGPSSKPGSAAGGHRDEDDSIRKRVGSVIAVLGTLS
jgi:hypothetical protein